MFADKETEKTKISTFMKATITRQDLPGLIISAIIGLGLTFLGVVKFKNANETKSWPVTQGTVTASEVAGSIKYNPSVNYTYSVNGTEYSSNQIGTMNFRTKNKSVAEEVVAKYQAGAAVEVHYNSKNPSDAYLEPGTETGHFLLLLIGILVLSVPVFSLVLIKLDLKKPSQS